MTRRSLLSLIVFLCLGATALAPATAGAAPADHQTFGAATRIDYPGNGIEIARQSGDQSKLKGTSGSFKSYVTRRLEVLFRDVGMKPRCATSPTVIVDRYHSAGWATAGEGWYGKCPEGGYAVIYEKTASGWRQILGTQEARFCQDLAWYGVPRFIGGPKCITEEFEQVRYRRTATPVGSPEATARRVTSVAGGNPIVPKEAVVLAESLVQLHTLMDRKAHLSLDECVTAEDGGPFAVHLGNASDGCAVTATYPNGTTESIMLRMYANDGNLLVGEFYRFG